MKDQDTATMLGVVLWPSAECVQSRCMLRVCTRLTAPSEPAQSNMRKELLLKLVSFAVALARIRHQHRQPCGPAPSHVSSVMINKDSLPIPSACVSVSPYPDQGQVLSALFLYSVSYLALLPCLPCRPRPSVARAGKTCMHYG